MGSDGSRRVLDVGLTRERVGLVRLTVFGRTLS